MISADRPFVLLDDARAAEASPARLYRDPVETIFACGREDAAGALDRLRGETRPVAGFIAYEAGHALEPKLARLGSDPPLPLVWFGFWAFFWVIASVVTLLPQTTTVAARLVGVGRGADFVLYLSVIALFYLIFRLFVKIEDLELEITRLVRKLALEESEKE